MRSTKIQQSGFKLPSERRFVLLIILVVFLLYGNSIKNNFSLDDDFVTSTFDHPNKRIEKGIRGIPDLFTSRYVETDQQSFSYRPLVLVTFAIEYEIFGINPHISHFINVLLFALLCILLYKILLRLFKNSEPLLALVAILLFAAHPLHTEVVDSLKNRDELLSFFFGASAIYYAVKTAEVRTLRPFLISVFFLCLSLITKETSLVLLPLILISVFLFYPSGRNQMMLTAIGVIGTLLFFYVFRKLLMPEETLGREFVFTENPLLYDHNIISRIPASLYVLLYYLKLMIVPFPLSAYYGYNTVSIADWSDPMVWLSLVIHLCLLFLVIKYFRKQKVLVYGILFYLLAIVPYSNFFRPAVGIVAERFVLAASFGFCIVLSFSIVKLFSRVSFSSKELRSGKPAIIVAAAIFIWFSLRTISRNNDWKDLNTLFNRDLSYYPDSYNLHYIYANSLSSEIMKHPNHPRKNEIISEAINHYREVARIVESGLRAAPSDYISRNNLGTIYVNYLNEPARALPLFKESIELNPAYTEAHYNLGFCYERLKHTDSAAANYEIVIKMNDHHLEAYKHLDLIYQDKQLFSKAITAGEKAIKMFPENAELYINLGNAQLSDKDTINGIKNFERAVEAEPGNTNLKQQIFHFFQSIGYEPVSGTWRNLQIK
jgi:4-amino-4-deoxy-L-arabinose transferase-like glycosyltransferase